MSKSNFLDDCCHQKSFSNGDSTYKSFIAPARQATATDDALQLEKEESDVALSMCSMAFSRIT